MIKVVNKLGLVHSIKEEYLEMFLNDGWKIVEEGQQEKEPEPKKRTTKKK